MTSTSSAADRRRDAAIAAVLFAATFGLMLATEEPIGFARDEGYYFRAGEGYAAWFADLWETPADALRDAGIVRHWRYNSEHPALAKTLFGLSHALFSERLGWLRHAAGFRLPAFAFSGLVSALLYLLGARLLGRRPAVLAVLFFWATPRQFHHGHLAAFDMPVTAMWLLVVWTYRASLEPGAGRRWGVFAGLAWGLALATKLNAFFLPPALGLHWLLTRGWRAFRAGGVRGLVRSVPPAFGFMALLGPLVFFAHWPYLWHAPVKRTWDYLQFHLQHVHYPWQYFGQDLREPPFPVEYVLVLTALTVPLPLVVLQAAGVANAAWTSLRGFAREATDDVALVLVQAAVPILVVSNPWAPHFGGVKHWLPAMPFLCLLAAASLERAGACAASLVRRPPLTGPAVGALAALTLAPAIIGVTQAHPWGTVFYNELAGGGSGAAPLGFQRQFWSNNVTAVLPWLNAHAPEGARVWLHEVNGESFHAYQRDGMLRADLRLVPDARSADLVAHQYMHEFRDQEFQAWNELGTTQASYLFAWHEAPQVTVYVRRGLQLR